MRRVRLDEARSTMARPNVRNRSPSVRGGSAPISSSPGSMPGGAAKGMRSIGSTDMLSQRAGSQAIRRSCLLETVADAVQCLDHVEAVVDRFELLAQALDVAVDGAIVDIDLIVVGRIHQGVAALDHARAR